LLFGHQEIQPKDVDIKELRWNEKEEEADDHDDARDAIIKRRRIERSKPY